MKRLVAYLKTEKNTSYVQEIAKKLPDLENELRGMRATIAEEEKKTMQKPKSPVKSPAKSPNNIGKSPPKSAVKKNS